MKKITSRAELDDAILLLETKEKADRTTLTAEIKNTVENFSTTDFIEDKMVDLVTSGEIKSVLLNVGMSLATNYISNKFLHKEKITPLKQIAGVLLQMATQKAFSSLQSKLQNPQTD